jgi:hypothetical protein
MARAKDARADGRTSAARTAGVLDRALSGRIIGMATWDAFEQEASDLAAALKMRFQAAKTHVLATLREDGSPRVSGSEVDFRGPDLSFGSMLGARKAKDLQRDGRCAIHAHPHEDGDAKVAGVAVEVSGPQKATYTTGSEPPGGFHAFRLDVTEAVLTAVEGNELVVTRWRQGKGVKVFRRT